MNATTYAVLTPIEGGSPVVYSQNSVDYWEMINSGYKKVHEGTKRECNEYFEELMLEILSLN